ncbi:bifunctional D-glycero-beta-D-manno-heptose-7-phosphate kinase/D-glycero-beta-D-manno-heptose 1-phosphate adenylyltransferase HldE [Suttonella ornithocola]|uniref:Bifunctional protein HldE n=1 Tax=Suttonella ornithocola TaxID=279832 RepID=A0A380MM56_9GAMM|nr:bifunctional D-glycero-beta-D-manno-heptose-7-phosphate kinase/D-glycero-beta-D-manno-heptose 1-phosphate adenylyltransferase HldE [Suttonella ornithocola]SUO93690.1 Bifunctional protein hldE [Suttonella ornithocola]
MSKQRITPDFKAARVLVVGDVMLDRNWSGAAQRISPEAPVPVVNIETCCDTLGGAANVAMNIATLGGQVSLCGLIGEDEAGANIRQFLKLAAIGDLLHTITLPTITKLRVLSRHQQLIRLDFESKAYANFSEQLLPSFHQALETHDIVVFSDYAKGALARISSMIALAKAAGKTILVDPKGQDFHRYQGADLLTPNRSELEAIVGCVTEDNLVEKARQCLLEIGVKALLVTLSEKGMCYIDAHQVQTLPATAREVFDVTGAGDTVIATVAAALSAQYPLETAIHFANAAAGVAVGKLGTATVSPLELRAALEPERARSHGFVSQSELSELLDSARARGQKIVMTNGCFDILHAGHVTYLEEAKALGDRLVVAVNTDESVRRLKGADRPANTLESRAQVLAALQSVDWVVAFEEDTPAALIEAVNPDVLVKGGDNQIENIPGAQWVLEQGGEVKILSYVDGFSTTKTLSKYLQQER